VHKHLARITLTVLLVAACAGGSPATPAAPTPAATPLAATTPVATADPETPSPDATPTAAPSSEAPSEEPSSRPATVEPGSSLDPSLSDAGVVGRLTIVNDIRGDRSGTYDIIGLGEDGSDCSFSFEGDEFTALAWYDAAPEGMLHQMALTIPTDTVPVNDGEQRAAIPDGRFYADFVSESGFGTAYSGAPEQDDGTLKVDAVRRASTLTLSFSGTTWDAIEFEGQMICTGLVDQASSSLPRTQAPRIMLGRVR